MKDSGNVVDGVLSIINTAIVIWVIVRHLPSVEERHTEERKNRDEQFLKMIDSYRQTLKKFQITEDESHKEIVRMINGHDKYQLEANLKISQILAQLTEVMHKTR